MDMILHYGPTRLIISQLEAVLPDFLASELRMDSGGKSATLYMTPHGSIKLCGVAWHSDVTVVANASEADGIGISATKAIVLARHEDSAPWALITAAADELVELFADQPPGEESERRSQRLLSFCKLVAPGMLDSLSSRLDEAALRL